ncbi:hypothetical protein [Enterococcus wangshanyuanii]|uniref:Uncharacterized protein n=1 Tax=Enterococcus wangshanyuanii TaxID=2005703 RepID=A0ABQ1NHY3_9ENTE|nr:hypothetical protein [Enterococcus wangshanyuanii]GGC74670.1 hypothetical protein GCM10011573_00210 [Enterococcus wangshanyuanii]
MGYTDIKEMFQDAKNLATGANDLQLKNVLLEIQTAVYELQEENRGLRNKIHELENEKILDSELEFHQGVYTRGNEVFCNVCRDKNKQLSRVRFSKKHDNGTNVYICDVCKNWRFSDIKD